MMLTDGCGKCNLHSYSLAFEGLRSINRTVPGNKACTENVIRSKTVV
jgi:hypothetical protein